MDPDTGEITHYYKAIRLMRVERLPKAAKQSTSLMDQQEQVLAAMYTCKVNLITIVANIINPVPIGFMYLYGVQGIGHSIEEAQEKANVDFQRFWDTMQATFKVLEMKCLKAQEAEWLREKMYTMDCLTVIRGIPKANKAGVDIGNKGMGGSNLNPDSHGTIEEIVAGLADYEYILQIISTPVAMSTLEDWSYRTEQEMSDWYGKLQGTKAFSMSLSIPMMMMANQSSSSGWNKAYTDAESVSYSQGESFNTSYGENVGQALSQSYGQSYSQSTGTTITDSVTQSHNITQGTSFGESFGESFGQSSGQSFGESFGHGTNQSISESLSEGQGISHNQGTSIGQGTSISQGQSHNISQGQSITNSHNFGTSQSNSFTTTDTQSGSVSTSHGETTGESTGVNFGKSQSDGYTNGVSSSFGQSYSKGESNGWNVGGSLIVASGGGNWGNSTTEGVSSSTGNSFSASHTDGTSQGMSFGNSFSQSDTVSNSFSQSHGVSKGESFGFNESFGQSHGQSLSEGWGVNQSVSQTQNISQSQSDGWSQNVSHTNGMSQGTSENYGQSFSENIGQNTSQSSSKSFTQNQSESYGVSQGHSVGKSYSESISQSVSKGETQSYGQSQSVGQGQSYSNGKSTSQGQSIGSSGAYVMGSSSSMGLGPSLGYNKSYQWLDQQVKDILELLEFKNERYKKSLRGKGAFYVYVYLACSDQDVLASAMAIAKAAWQNEFAMCEPLQVLDLEEEEQKHLLYHFSAFSSDTTRMKLGGVSVYKYGTVLLTDEYVAYTHLPRISEGGVWADVNDIPKFAVPSGLTGEIYMGNVMSAERYTFQQGYDTPYDYRIDESELMHGFFIGASRSGKTVAAMRFAAELAQVKENLPENGCVSFVWILNRIGVHWHDLLNLNASALTAWAT